MDVDTVTFETWFIDVNLNLANHPGDELIEALVELTEPLYGAIAAGPGNKLGLSLAVDCLDSWEAYESAHMFIEGPLATLLPEAAISSLRVMNKETRTEENMSPQFPELVTVPDIAELLGVSRQRAGQLASRKGFPVPSLTPRTGPLWTRAAVEAWKECTDRPTGRPRGSKVRK